MWYEDVRRCHCFVWAEDAGATHDGTEAAQGGFASVVVKFSATFLVVVWQVHIKYRSPLSMAKVEPLISGQVPKRRTAVTRFPCF